MTPEEKIWRFSHSKKIPEYLDRKQVVLCYGHFNIIHPGHIRYLENARKEGTHLVVALQGDKTKTHSGNNHSFSELDRALGVALLHIVDVVIILDNGVLKDVIDLLRPVALVVGKEFERERYQQIQTAVEALHEFGGKIIFHAGEIQYASTELLREEVVDLQSERKELFRGACQRQQLDLEELLGTVERFQENRLLVLGDTIVDQYIACDALGMSAEAPVLVVRELKARDFLGGAAIVASHVRSLGAKCHFISVVGRDSKAEYVKKQLKNFDISHRLITDSSRPTTFKMRYMVENQKLFRVSRLQEHSLSLEIENKVIELLRKLAPQMDGILVSDFVYGVITEKILNELQELKEKHGLKLMGDLQCSSQIGNVGKFENFDLLTPTEKEARFALGNRDDSVEWIANTLMKQTRTKNLLIKLGGAGFIAYTNEEDGFVNRQHFPALSANPVDVTGAGDSFFAAVAVSLCAGNPMMKSAVLGAFVASLAVQNIGNKPVTKHSLERLIKQML